MENELEKSIGTRDKPTLTAGSVIVDHVSIAPPKEGSKAKIVSLFCKHPARTELVKLSNLKLKKVQGNNETITKDGIWFRIDDDGNIDKNCNAAKLMLFYKKTSLKDFIGSPIDTELDAAGYLTIKAY